MPTIARTAKAQRICSAATGKSGMAYRQNPKVPIFSSTPARMIDPATGASVCASGNQVCTGNIGTLIAKAIAKPRNIQGPYALSVSAIGDSEPQAATFPAAQAASSRLAGASEL